ncbi:MAG: hypothetical protein Q8N53_03745 [Longimicrobiales bacterium]|nr:hypothetical protein [Longimicrobiales bacterium]
MGAYNEFINLSGTAPALGTVIMFYAIRIQAMARRTGSPRSPRRR